MIPMRHLAKFGTHFVSAIKHFTDLAVIGAGGQHMPCISLICCSQFADGKYDAMAIPPM